MKKKILVTGGSGFIGSEVIKDLKNLDYNVFSVGRNKNEDLQINIADPKLQDVINDFAPDVICHFASGSNIQNTSLKGNEEEKNVISSCKNLLKSIKNLEKFIYLSSQAVYGFPNSLPIKEDCPLNPINKYGELKKEIEELILKSKIPFNIFRVSTVFGPMQDFKKSGVVANFINKLENNESPIVFNTFESFVDLIYITDVKNAIVKSIENPEIKNEIFNLSSGKPTKLTEILSVLYKFFPNAPEPILKENELYGNKDQKGIYLSTEKIKEKLNFKCKYNLEDGIKEILERKIKVS